MGCLDIRLVGKLDVGSSVPQAFNLELGQGDQIFLDGSIGEIDPQHGVANLFHDLFDIGGQFRSCLRSGEKGISHDGST